mgnify:CR=1 FL=1
MSFIKKFKEKKSEIEKEIIDSNVNDEKYKFISDKLEQYEKEVEDLLLYAYFDKMSQAKYSELYTELFDKIEQLHVFLYELDKMLSKVSKNNNMYSNRLLLGDKYRKIKSDLENATNNINVARKYVLKILENEQKENEFILYNSFTIVVKWQNFCVQNLNNLLSSKYDGLLGEIKFQNDKIEFIEYAGRTYHYLKDNKVQIQQLAQTGLYDTENITNIISYIDENMLKIIELIHSLPLHVDGTFEYFKDEYVNNESSLQSINDSMMNPKEMTVKNLKHIFRVAYSSYIGEQIPESFQDEITNMLVARFYGADAVLKNLNNSYLKFTLPTEKFEELKKIWNFVKFSASNSLNYLNDVKEYINYLPYKQNNFDIETDTLVNKKMMSN